MDLECTCQKLNDCKSTVEDLTCKNQLLCQQLACAEGKVRLGSGRERERESVKERKKDKECNKEKKREKERETKREKKRKGE